MNRQQIECGITRGAGGEGGQSREVVISTERPVRSGGGIARAGGAVLAPYLRNPVVMWGHNYKEPPIARATDISIQPGVGMLAKFEFPPTGIHPLADTVRGLWDAGFINAASIGFAPLEWEMIDDPEAAPQTAGARARMEQIPVYTRWELYEFSLVAVPRDRDAVRRALDALSSAPQRGGRDAHHPRALDALSSAPQRGGRDARHREALEALVPEAAAVEVPGLDMQRLLDGLRAVRRGMNGK